MKLLQLLGIIIIYTVTVSVADSSGSFNLQAVERVIAGKEASQGQIPYAAALTFPKWFCSGIIVSNRFILTAGHCVVDAKTVEVTLGATDVTGNAQTGTQILQVDENGIKPHPNYTESDLQFDIGLVRTNEDIIFTIYVQPIALPNCGSNPPPVNTPVEYSGYGYVANIPLFGGYGVGKLRYGKGTILPPSACNLTGSAATGTLCVGSVLTSVCNGDSGGPLTAYLNNIKTLVGIVSYGFFTCNTVNFFTDVSHYGEFIRNEMGIVCPS